MTTFLALQHTYTTVEFGLFSGTSLLASMSVDKIHASKNLIPLLNAFLKDQQTSLADLSFLAVNQGPGPFTTLRVVIATVNGLSFATQLPLVGVDGLGAFLDEQHTSPDKTVVAILNAFNHDVYFGIQQGAMRTVGCMNYEQLFIKLASVQTPLFFVGNAVSMYHEKIVQLFGERAILEQPIAEHPCLQQIGENALAQWRAGDTTTRQLLPLYLKQYSAVMPQ